MSAASRWETLAAGDRSARVRVALPPDSPHGGVLLFHAWWGLNDDSVAFAERLAGEGFAVVAPDLFEGNVATTIPGAERLAAAADEAAIEAIGLAAADRLAGIAAPGPLATLGFSFGAGSALWVPAERDRFGATILYYGTSGGPVLARTKAPILGHFAEDDPYESDDWVAAFEGTLRDAGREVTIHHYSGTGHWFAEPSREAYDAQAAELAFTRTVDFIRRTK